MSGARPPPLRVLGNQRGLHTNLAQLGTTYGFPVTPITFSSDSVDGRIIPPGVSAGPPPTQVDPQLESLVSDENGGIYVLTGWEGHGGPYASVYKVGT
jgi:hypothetical protein